MLVKELQAAGKINPPSWQADATQFMAITGSQSYGVSSDSSDMDIYGMYIQPKEIAFPHVGGYIDGFGAKPATFDTFSVHGIKDPSKQREYDLTFYGIAKFFNLAMKNSPVLIDVLFVPDNCVLLQTNIGKMLREGRRTFLHRGAWHTYKGFAYNNFHRYKITDPAKAANEKRADLIRKYGFDTKGMYHVVRLMGEVEQILTEGDLDIQRNRRQLIDIRNGHWTLQEVEDFFKKKELELETVYLNSHLPYSADEVRIKQLLMNCLEEYFGDIGTVVSQNPSMTNFITDLEAVIKQYR